MNTPGVGPGYAISSIETFNWEGGYPVWQTVSGATSSQAGAAAFLQLVNDDSASQNFNYYCDLRTLGGVGTISSITDSSNCFTVNAGTTKVLFQSNNLPANTLTFADFGVTVDPSSSTTEIHASIHAYLTGGVNGADMAGVDRAEQYWETFPVSGGTSRLPLDVTVFGLNGYTYILTFRNFDSTNSHYVCYDADLWSVGTATRYTLNYKVGTIYVNAGYGVLVTCLASSDMTRVYFATPYVGLDGGDEAQNVNWVTIEQVVAPNGATSTNAESSESLFHWWAVGDYYYNSFSWREPSSTQGSIQFCLIINNVDSASQTFYYALYVYYY